MLDFESEIMEILVKKFYETKTATYWFIATSVTYSNVNI